MVAAGKKRQLEKGVGGRRPTTTALPASEGTAKENCEPACDVAVLTAEDSAAAECRWASLEDSALDLEIHRYRASLKTAEAQLVDLGLEIDSGEGQDGDKQGEPTSFHTPCRPWVPLPGTPPTDRRKG